VCAHPDRTAIDANLAEGGRSNRALSQTFLLSEDSIARHKRNHLPKIVAQAAQEKGAERGADLLSRIRTAEEKLGRYESVALNLAHRGAKDGDAPLVLRALAEARRSSVESRLKLWGLELQVTEVRELDDRIREIEQQVAGDSWVR
jgi:hypothetical protein